MKTKYYTTRSQFYGFYESDYYHSDMEYDYNNLMDDELPKGKHYELTKFKEYQKALCKEWIDLVKHQLEFATGNVIKKISTRNFELDSPKEYNFTTDKLIVNVEFRLRALEHWCLKDKPEEFNKYLKENYSSYDGFISFIPNSIDAFKEKYFNEYKTFEERERNNLINVMLEFYFECQIDFESDVNEEIVNWREENLSNYMRLVKD